jgi:hypothetical protein
MKIDVIAAPPPPSNPNAMKDMANKEVESKKQQQEAAANSKKALQQRADAEKRLDACKSARAEISRLAADQIILYSVNEKGETIVMNEADRRRRRETLILQGQLPGRPADRALSPKMQRRPVGRRCHIASPAPPPIFSPGWPG